MVCPRDCYDTCSLNVVVSDNRVIRVEADKSHPITRGIVCPRARKDPERVYSKNRVLYPHIKVGMKPHGTFKRVDWNTALNIIVERLRETLRLHGPSAVLHIEYAGNMGLLTWYYPQRLWNAIGATRTDYSICSRSGHEAIALHYGLSYGIQPEELPNQKLIVYWGFNAASSALHIWAITVQAKHHGATIAVVDPIESPTAKAADIWVSPRPGSDVALAYGIANYLLTHEYIDHDFLSKHAYGYEVFLGEARKWTPSKVERITGVKWSDVERLGEAYGRLRPSATMIGIGLQKSANGAEAARAISLIPALLGYHRGFYYSNSKGWPINIAYLTGESFVKSKPRVVSQVKLGKLLERGEFKFVFIYNCNPLATFPEYNALVRGLSRSDVFVVVHDTHWSETALLADVVLPAPTYLEKRDVVVSYSHGYLRVSERAIDPLEESKDEIWLSQEIAKRLGLREQWLYEDPWHAVASALRGALSDKEIERLMRGETVKLKSRPREEYQTPTGKIEFYSTRARKLGASPIPVQPMLEDYEFILITSSIPNYTNSQFQDVYGRIDLVVYMNVLDAKELGISDGSTIEVYNELDALTARVKVTERVPRKVLWAPKVSFDLSGKPVNAVIPSNTQSIGGGPTFNSTTVRVCKKA